MEAEEKGICRLSVVPVRTEAADQSEMVSQLLFGDHYTVTEVAKSKKWVKIKIYYDSYEGWIDARQHHIISEAYFNQINNADYKICTDLTSSILFHKHHISILIGSILPIATSELFKIEEQLAFNGESKSLSQKREYEYVKNIAIKYLGAPYLWGGRSPFGIDCSGFIQNIFKISGYKLPRDASQQVKSGVKVDTIENSMPGDLAFFKNKSGKITHVGMLLEEGGIIHASGRVRIDRIDNTGIIDMETDKYSHALALIRRIIPNSTANL